jgi:phosphate starvation-inducible protein PhoH
MSKKIVKYKSSLFNQEVKLIIDGKSSGIDLKKVAPAKLAKANEALKGVILPR